MSEWQDIATAPKDGTWFIAANFGGGTIDPSFDYEIGCYEPFISPRFVDAGNGLYRKVEEIVMEWRFNNFHIMTHWMPLPPPPQETKP